MRLGSARFRGKPSLSASSATGGDLQAAQKLLEEGFSAVQQHLQSLTDADLARTYTAPDGKTQKTLGELFQMLLEHCFYHAGQIVYIRNLWAGLHPPPP
jgi:uncharacterized damage-inducible protein DinB